MECPKCSKETIVMSDFYSFPTMDNEDDTVEEGEKLTLAKTLYCDLECTSCGAVYGNVAAKIVYPDICITK